MTPIEPRRVQSAYREFHPGLPRIRSRKSQRIEEWLAATRIQQNQKIVTAPPPFSTFGNPYGSNNTAGNTLIAQVRWSVSPFEDVTVSDILGNTWHRGPATGSASTQNLSLWYATNCLAGSNSVIVSFASATGLADCAVRVLEYSGANTFDTQASGSGNSFSASNTFTPAGAGELAVVGLIDVSLTFRSITAGYSQIGGPGSDPMTFERLSCPAGAQTVTADVTASCCCVCVSQPWAIATLVFKNIVTAQDAIFYNHT